MLRNKNVKSFVLLFIIFSVLGISCALPSISGFEVEKAGAEEIFSRTTNVTLAWSYDNPGEVQLYKIYYRAHGDVDWIHLVDVAPSTFPSFNVSNSSVGNGSWVFGVSAIDNQGTESEIHSSLDIEADPSTGWYLLWIK